MPAGYTLSPDGTAITCHRCWLTSHNLHDVEHRYCGRCHIFHEDDYPLEFDCRECGRHIISFSAAALFQRTPPGIDICGACVTIPGWFNEPEIARILDPDNTRRPRAVQSMIETPIYDRLREQIATLTPLVIGQMVVDIAPSRCDALAAELVGLGIAFERGYHGRQVKIDGAVVLF